MAPQTVVLDVERAYVEHHNAVLAMLRSDFPRLSDSEAASHFFQVVSRRYEHGSIVLTTNRHIADWATSSTTAASPPPSSTASCTTRPS